MTEELTKAERIQLEMALSILDQLGPRIYKALMARDVRDNALAQVAAAIQDVIETRKQD
jgi:hypothetical protein